MKLFNKFYNWAKPEGWLSLSICFFLFLLAVPGFWALVPNKALAMCLTVTLIEAIAAGFTLYKSLDGQSASWHGLICDNIGIGIGLVVFIWITFLIV